VAIHLAVVETIVRKICLRIGDRRGPTRGDIQKKETGPACANQSATFTQADATANRAFADLVA